MFTKVNQIMNHSWISSPPFAWKWRGALLAFSPPVICDSADGTTLMYTCLFLWLAEQWGFHLHDWLVMFSKWRALMKEEVWKCHPVYESSSGWYDDTPVTLQGNEVGFHSFWIMWRQDLFLSLQFKWTVVCKICSYLFLIHSENNSFYPLSKLKLYFLILYWHADLKKLWQRVFMNTYHLT